MWDPKATQNYIDEAAIFQFDKVKTPTHIVARRAATIRVAVAEDYLLEHALHTLGIPSSLLVFPDEGHSLDQNPWHGKIKVREESAWIEKLTLQSRHDLLQRCGAWRCAFYRDLMGFKLIEDFRYEGKSVYARLRAPGGDGTIALHQAGPGASRCQRWSTARTSKLRELDDFCRKLQQKGLLHHPACRA